MNSPLEIFLGQREQEGQTEGTYRQADYSREILFHILDFQRSLTGQKKFRIEHLSTLDKMSCLL